MEENKYKEAIERAKSAIKECGDNVGRIKMIESIFPELAESKEENIRKSILMMFRKALPDVFNRYGTNKNDAIAYMEKLKDIDKQLEDAYKTADEVQYKRGYDFGYVEGVAFAKQELEKQVTIKDGNSIDPHFGKPITTAETKTPKFKVGDWIVDKFGFVQQVLDFRGGIYTCTYNSFTVICESNYHLWTIQDAKDGDVLAEDSCIFIIQKLEKNNTAAKTYCALYSDGDFDNGSMLYFDIDSTKPATKEQCELLFRKIADEGYEWDAEKKKLKITDFTKHLKYNPKAPSIIEQKTVWSEEDEKNLQGVIDEIQANKSNAPEYDLKTYDRFLSWLKSIEERVQPQPKQDGKWKWDEDDEKFFKENILVGLGNIDEVSEELYGKIIDWVSLIKKRLS